MVGTKTGPWCEPLSLKDRKADCSNRTPHTPNLIFFDLRILKMDFLGPPLVFAAFLFHKY